MLFVKRNIGFRMPIWVTHCTFLLDSKNALMSKCDISLMMLFPHSFLLDIVSTNRQKMPMDAKKHVLFSSIDSPLTGFVT
jgi:hypothetical protein